MAGLYDFNYIRKEQEIPKAVQPEMAQMYLSRNAAPQTLNVPQVTPEPLGLKQKSFVNQPALQNDFPRISGIRQQAWDSTIEKVPYHSMSTKIAGDKYRNAFINTGTVAQPIQETTEPAAPVEAAEPTTPSAPPAPAVPRELMLTPSQEKPYLAIQQSVLDNPDDPTKWGQKGIVPRLTDNGTAMPNGWGVVKDSKGRVHIAPPTHWNFFGDTQAEKKWRDKYEKDVKNRELNQTLHDEAIKARSSFVGPKRRAQAVDSMLGLQSLEQGAANASSAGLSSALNAIANREAALAKEGRANQEKVFLQLREILQNSYEKTGDKEIDKANAGKAATIETRMRQDPRILNYINTLDQADLVKTTGQLAKQGLMDQRVRDSNSNRMGLNRAVMDWSFWNPSTWVGNKPYAGGKLIDMDGMDIEDRGIITGVALYNTHYRDLVRNGEMSPPRALELLNARLIEEGFPPLSALPA